jgi:galactose-6-phosphate isomerase
MPEIDVTDVLLGSAVAGEEFLVQRRQEVVTQQGKGTVPNPLTFPAFGSVQPEGDNDMIREEDFDSQAHTIEVITPFRLRGDSTDAAGNSFKGDIVIWKGNNYVVKRVEDYSSFGPGWVLASCTSEDFVDAPPA